MLLFLAVVGQVCEAELDPDVASVLQGVPEQRSPVLVPLEKVRVADHDEERLGAGDGHVEPLGAGQEAQS